MVKIDKEYVFDGTDGQASLLDLFNAASKLIIYTSCSNPGRRRPLESGEPCDEGCRVVRSSWTT